MHVVTLGVADLGRAAAFYGRLGWRPAPPSNDAIVFFDLGCLVLALFERAALAADAGVEVAGEGFRAVTLAHNVGSPEAVAATLAEAVAAGATLVKPAAKADWGGTSGYFADPDGHLWEVAHNPFLPLDADGYMRLSG
jgi:catechol 2,3-dioxygenase-like lactoylglutathione lyase family enzyme